MSPGKKYRRNDFRSSIRIRVRFRDLDTFQHLNNGVYLSLFEEARTEYMACLPSLQETMKEKGPLSAIMEAFPTTLIRSEVEVRGQAFLHDYLDVCVRVESIRKSFIDMEYGVFRSGSDEKIARGSTTLVHINLESFKPKTVPVESIQELEEFEGRSLTGGGRN